MDKGTNGDIVDADDHYERLVRGSLKVIEKQKVDILQTTKEGYYPEDHVFTWDNGFNIAVALTAYDSEWESILDPSIADFNFYAS